MFSGYVFLELREDLDAEKPDTFVKANQVDIMEIKDRKDGCVRVRLYLEHGQEVEGWLPKGAKYGLID